MEGAICGMKGSCPTLKVFLMAYHFGQYRTLIYHKGSRAYSPNKKLDLAFSPLTMDHGNNFS